MILDNPPEGMKQSLRRKSDSSLYRSSRRLNKDYNDGSGDDMVVRKEKFIFKSGRDRAPEEE